MPRLDRDLPEHLKLYLFYGVDLDWSANDDNAIGECPWCFTEGKFAVHIETGMCKCWVCGRGSEKGGTNSLGFLRYLQEDSFENTQDYKKLAESRGLLSSETLIHWQVSKSVITGDWLVPGYTPEGKLNQLYKYHQKLFAGPNLKHQLFGVNLFDKKKPIIYLCEGPWDAMALWETLGCFRETEEGELVRTSSKKKSLLAEANILAIPGCNTFKPEWSQLFSNKIVCLLFDSDYPKQKTEKTKALPPAGFSGMKRVAGIINSNTKPSSLHYLKWGEEGFDPELPNHTDIRDLLTSSEDRKEALSEILSKLTLAPGEWATQEVEDNKLKCVTCKNYLTVRTAWKKALRWIEGLDTALSVMLASVISTKMGGDQLWVKVIGPPACLHAQTWIHDPVEKTTSKVKDRWEEEEPFHVWSMNEFGDLIIAKALPPKKFKSEEMFKVVFASGKSIKVTGGHRFWNGTSFVALSVIDFKLNDDFCYPLPNYPPISLEVDHEFESKQDAIVSITSEGKQEYFDFHVPETNNYWAQGFFHHNCGKSTLCEAITVSSHIYSKSTIRGFHSGFKSDGDGSEDNSLIAKARDKTLVTKDGDTLLQSPNIGQILSEARDIYDRNSRTHYRNKVDRDYSGIDMTWLLCGTNALRAIDDSELGQRFLDCVIMEEIDDELEEEIAWIAVKKASKNVTIESDGSPQSGQDPAMIHCMQITGGYVEYLRRNASRLISQVVMSEEVERKCIRLAKFVSLLRARPSRNSEKEGRELSSRLIGQLTRLTKCLTAVLNKVEVDEEVIEKVTKVALDTSRGQTLDIIDYIQDRIEEDGAGIREIAIYTHLPEPRAKRLLVFLSKIKAVESFQEKQEPGSRRQFTQTKWRLTKAMKSLYEEVIT